MRGQRETKQDTGENGPGPRGGRSGCALRDGPPQPLPPQAWETGLEEAGMGGGAATRAAAPASPPGRRLPGLRFESPLLIFGVSPSSPLGEASSWLGFEVPILGLFLVPSVHQHPPTEAIPARSTRPSQWASAHPARPAATRPSPGLS